MVRVVWKTSVLLSFFVGALGGSIFVELCSAVPVILRVAVCLDWDGPFVFMGWFGAFSISPWALTGGNSSASMCAVACRDAWDDFGETPCSLQLEAASYRECPGPD